MAAVVAVGLLVHVQMGGEVGVPRWIQYAVASTTRTVYFPPLTGHDMVEFLDENADRLRGTLKDFDGLREFSAAVGDRPLIAAMRAETDADQRTLAEAPKAPEAPDSTETP